MIENNYPFALIPLRYPTTAMEPVIDEETMILHHDKHLKTYVDTLNHIIEQYPEFQKWSLDTFLFNLFSLPDTIREKVKNNAGGVYNHVLYFNILTKPKEHNRPIRNNQTKNRECLWIF